MFGPLGGHQGLYGVSGVYWGLAGSVGTQGQKGYRWHMGHLRIPRGIGDVVHHMGASGDVGGVRGVLRTGR